MVLVKGQSKTEELPSNELAIRYSKICARDPDRGTQRIQAMLSSSKLMCRLQDGGVFFFFFS